MTLSTRGGERCGCVLLGGRGADRALPAMSRLLPAAVYATAAVAGYMYGRREYRRRLDDATLAELKDALAWARR
jgi:hypothetical protein